MENNNINNPKHYTCHPSGIQCIEITEHCTFNIGNAIKYIWRHGLKQDTSLSTLDKKLEDLQKAKWYIDREMQRLIAINLPLNTNKTDYNN